MKPWSRTKILEPQGGEERHQKAEDEERRKRTFTTSSRHANNDPRGEVNEAKGNKKQEKRGEGGKGVAGEQGVTMEPVGGGRERWVGGIQQNKNFTHNTTQQNPANSLSFLLSLSVAVSLFFSLSLFFSSFATTTTAAAATARPASIRYQEARDARSADCFARAKSAPFTPRNTLNPWSSKQLCWLRLSKQLQTTGSSCGSSKLSKKLKITYYLPF